MTDYPNEYADWQAKRLAALKAPNGWLNIIARVWLAEGTVTVGSAADNDIILSSGPSHIGSLTQDADGQVTYTPEDGAPQVLELSKYNPPRFTAGNLLLEVTTLNGENALRVRDTTSDAPEKLQPLDYFPLDPPGASPPIGSSSKPPRASLSTPPSRSRPMSKPPTKPSSPAMASPTNSSPPTARPKHPNSSSATRRQRT